MAIFSVQEIIDLAVMIVAVGFIFKDTFPAPKKEDYDPLLQPKPGIDTEAFKQAIIVTAPAIALHEMAHKFVSIAAGVPATFHAEYLWLSIGVIIKLVGFPFIFFVPGYVSHAASTPLTDALIGFAGPATNLLLWVGAAALLKTKKGKKHLAILHMTKQINMFLFIFNMIPIPPFDGSHVLFNLIEVFF